jgi:hypothetical protein
MTKRTRSGYFVMAEAGAGSRTSFLCALQEQYMHKFGFSVTFHTDGA